jgi:hypothetical protein
MYEWGEEKMKEIRSEKRLAGAMQVAIGKYGNFKSEILFFPSHFSHSLSHFQKFTGERFF